jgi:CxxC motif-containing protein
MTKELICICCPMGCNLNVTMDGNTVVEVTGNTCNRGKDYAISEMTAPTRMVTSTIVTREGVSVPVKTATPIPKDKIFECMEEIKSADVSLPINVGDELVKNVAGTDVSVIATRSTKFMEINNE